MLVAPSAFRFPVTIDIKTDLAPRRLDDRKARSHLSIEFPVGECLNVSLIIARAPHSLFAPRYELADQCGIQRE